MSWSSHIPSFTMVVTSCRIHGEVARLKHSMMQSIVIRFLQYTIAKLCNSRETTLAHPSRGGLLHVLRTFLDAATRAVIKYVLTNRSRRVCSLRPTLVETWRAQGRSKSKIIQVNIECYSVCEDIVPPSATHRDASHTYTASLLLMSSKLEVCFCCCVRYVTYCTSSKAIPVL